MLWLAAAGCSKAGQAPGQGAAATPATLVVQVDPASGISILLDGNRVATTSPYVNANVGVGGHVLEVRGMGRHPVSLPLTLAAGARVEVPVVLRPRAPLAYVARPADPNPDLADAPASADAGLGAGAVAEVGTRPQAGAAAPPRVRPSLGARAHAPLPPGAQPLKLVLNPKPAATIIVDGDEAPANDVRLTYGQGLLQVGAMRLVYRVYPGRSLELTVPHESAAWFLGQQQIKAKSLVRLSASPVVLRRVTAAGDQQVWMKRLE